MSASQHGEIEGIVLRLSNAFGAPMDKDVNCWMLLVNDLCRQAAQTRKLLLHTSGSQQRDFVCLTEVCRVIQQLAVGGEGASSQGIFNVGAGASQTVLQMAQLIQRRCVQVFGFEPELQRTAVAPDEQKPELTFRTNRLAEANMSASLDSTAEVDSLLQFCLSNFGPSQEQAT